MREILFRGKRIDNGEWVSSGNLIHFIQDDQFFMPSFNSKCVTTHDENDHIIEMKDTRIYKVIPETVGQYTGLTDKNDTKIFEGDIVTMPSYGGGRHKSAVYFKKGKFAVDGSNYSFKDIAPKNMEVIGNIHDNPELLKGGTSDD